MGYLHRSRQPSAFARVCTHKIVASALLSESGIEANMATCRPWGQMLTFS
jgi:hypothetical protein